MRKLSIYSFLVAAVLLTGCSQKNVEMDGSAVDQNKDLSAQTTGSEAALNNVDSSNIQEEIINDTLAQKAENGFFYFINGKKVFVENVYFGFDKYNLDADMQKVTQNNAIKFSGLKANTKIKVEGNCDEWGTDEYNYALGLKRAKAVKDALVSEGINSEVISLVSFGESNPTCSDKNKECWKMNRRTEHKLLP